MDIYDSSLLSLWVHISQGGGMASTRTGSTALCHYGTGRRTEKQLMREACVTQPCWTYNAQHTFNYMGCRQSARLCRDGCFPITQEAPATEWMAEHRDMLRFVPGHRFACEGVIWICLLWRTIVDVSGFTNRKFPDASCIIFGKLENCKMISWPYKCKVIKKYSEFCLRRSSK